MTTAVIIHVSLCTALIAALLVKFASSFELVAATRAIFHPALFRPPPHSPHPNQSHATPLSLHPTPAFFTPRPLLPTPARPTTTPPRPPEQGLSGLGTGSDNGGVANSTANGDESLVTAVFGDVDAGQMIGTQ